MAGQSLPLSTQYTVREDLHMYETAEQNLPLVTRYVGYEQIYIFRRKQRKVYLFCPSVLNTARSTYLGDSRAKSTTATPVY